MHGPEKRARFQELRKTGLSRRAIARELGVSRRTLYVWEREGASWSGRSRPRPPVASILDPFKELIRERLALAPRLSAERVFQEIREYGYVGGYRLVSRYVSEVRPRRKEDPVVRFETKPGVQGQVDFATFRFAWGVTHAVVVLLGYSRMLWFRFVESQKQEVLIRGLEDAFVFFGGVPQELLFDQTKAVVVRDERSRGGELLKNRDFELFAEHWGFAIRACRPYRARTKGKVERAIRYLRDGFAYAREFASLEDANQQALRWLEQVGNRRELKALTRATGRKQTPLGRLEDGRPHLMPLMSRRWPGLRPMVSEARREASVGTVGSGVPRRVVVERRPLSEYAELAGS